MQGGLYHEVVINIKHIDMLKKMAKTIIDIEINCVFA
jgi:hypothetical protein